MTETMTIDELIEEVNRRATAAHEIFWINPNDKYHQGIHDGLYNLQSFIREHRAALEAGCRVPLRFQIIYHGGQADYSNGIPMEREPFIYILNTDGEVIMHWPNRVGFLDSDGGWLPYDEVVSSIREQINEEMELLNLTAVFVDREETSDD